MLTKSKIKLIDNYYQKEAVIPEVDGEIVIPKIKIYDFNNDGSYWFRRIGFTSKLTDDK